MHFPYIPNSIMYSSWISNGNVYFRIFYLKLWYSDVRNATDHIS